MENHYDKSNVASVLCGYLQFSFMQFPYDVHKDVSYCERLAENFPDLDVLEELKQFHSWTLDQPDTKKIYYRSRFRSWLKTARDLKQKHKPFWMSRYAAFSE